MLDDALHVISKGVRIHSKPRSLIEKRVVKKNRDMNYYNVILSGNGNNEIVLNHPGFNP